MVNNWRFAVVLVIGSIVVLGSAEYLTQESREFDEFTGLCVYSSGSFSVLTDGKVQVVVYIPLEEGRVYRVLGRLYNATGLKMEVASAEPAEPDFELETVSGAYWPSRGYYLLTPERVKLAFPLSAEKGELVLVKGVWYGRRFYPLIAEPLGLPKHPRDGMPWSVEGTVLYSGSRTVLWNGSEEIVLYLPYGVSVEPGERVRVLGLVREYSKLTLLVDSEDDVDVLGDAPEGDVAAARVGEIAVGNCTVIEAGRSLRLDCTGRRVYNFRARVGDTVSIRALVRRSSLYCLACSVVRPRELLPNSICDPDGEGARRISGRVRWVRVYKNGFGIANVTDGDCWVLLKIRKSLGVTIHNNQTVTAYGFFTTYRGMPAFEVQSGDDLCSGNC
ncbi:hypothetical protein E3E36_05640 [Thermococcus sp. M36]|uniref:hypothetical protein n=1 Tax=Thermococcus sp. M36 TaxID=1638261 RepID=UPI00143C00D8|nr:hypothetical protein [Thermococcus sp. M36]NJE05632.1 hypothetical protein [Thermococcus sp. M36]